MQLHQTFLQNLHLSSIYLMYISTCVKNILYSSKAFFSQLLYIIEYYYYLDSTNVHILLN